MNTRTAGIDIKNSTSLALLFLLVIRTQLYVWTNVHSLNNKIVPEELFPEMAKYTLPFSNSVKSA